MVASSQTPAEDVSSFLLQSSVIEQKTLLNLQHYLTLPTLTHLAPLKSLITLYINICKITFFPSTQYAYIYDSIFICKLCYKDKLGQTDKVLRVLMMFLILYSIGI